MRDERRKEEDLHEQDRHDRVGPDSWVQLDEHEEQAADEPAEAQKGEGTPCKIRARFPGAAFNGLAAPPDLSHLGEPENEDGAEGESAVGVNQEGQEPDEIHGVRIGDPTHSSKPNLASGGTTALSGGFLEVGGADLVFPGRPECGSWRSGSS